ncbi:MAG: hypothetical protein VYB93_05765 [Pseudomonadota bacterium]|nr:hypothetical protein [Pseudomonadota bacterium]
MSTTTEPTTEVAAAESRLRDVLAAVEVRPCAVDFVLAALSALVKANLRAWKAEADPR